MNTDLAYLGGFFDGDGCISLLPYPGRPSIYMLMVRVMSVTEASCQMFGQRFGGNVRRHKHTYRKKNGDLTQAFEWSQMAAKAGTVITTLQPYLRVKAENAAVALAYRAKLVRKGGGIPPENIAERARLCQAMRALNARGTDAPLRRLGPGEAAAIEAEELAYLAGLFDAEGTIAWINDRQRATPLLRIGVRATADLICWRFALRFGGSVNDHVRGNPRGIFGWYRRQARAVPVLQALLPYLREKRHAAEVALQKGIQPAKRLRLVRKEA